uniref:Tumor protein D52 n=1 Tax=Gallus gallus TaxID=9031 RepID=A0A8V0XMF1_CHICK
RSRPASPGRAAPPPAAAAAEGEGGDGRPVPRGRETAEEPGPPWSPTGSLVEEEIQTLSQVLAAKEKHLAEIKRKLGINSLQELKQNITKSWQDVTSTAAYKKTSETLSQAGQKASAAFSSVGSVITKKFEDVKNSSTFKSFEEKVETLKSKVGGSKPASGDFGEVLNSAANASATETIAEETQEETH